jgi:RHS repeat-associated protein
LAVVRFDAQGRLVATVDRNGNRDSVSYNGATDQVTAFIDPLGWPTALTYGGNGKLTTFTDPGGRQSRVTINGTSNQLTADSLSSPSTRGDRTTFTYQTYPGTQTTVLRKRIGVITDTTIVFYDSTFTRRPNRVRLAQVTDETGAIVTPAIKYVAYEQQGFRSLRSLDSVYVEMKDPLNNWTRSLLNRWAQPRKTWDAIGLLAKTEYDPDGLVRWSEGKNGDSSRVYHDYDAFRRLARTWITRGGNVLRLDSLVYDANHRVVKRIDARGKVDSLTYDSRGNLIETRDAAQNVTRTWYRASDGLVDSTRAPGEGTSVRYSYETTWKNLYQVTDAAGTVLATNAYDGLGRVVTSDRKIRVEKSGTSYNWQWRRTETFYDAAGQVDSTRLLLPLKCPDPCNTPTWPSNLTGLAQFQRVIRVFDRAGRDSLRINTNGTRVLTLYDRLGRVVSRRPWADSMAVKDSMAYDVAGNLKTTITRRGDQISVSYDSRNRATSTVIPGVGTLRKLFGGPQDQLTRMWYDTPTDSIGGINAELRWGYDSRGRLRADTSYTGTTARVTSYTYDAFERPGTMTDPLGTWATRYETDRGYPDTLVTPFADTLTYTYDARSRAVGPTVRSSGPLHSRTPAWKATGELGSLVTTSGVTTAGSYDRSTYTLGEDGQVALGPSWTDGAGQVIDSLTYDGWERVRTWTQSRLGTVIANESYSFDRSGNILTGSESYDTVTDRLLSRTDAGQTRSYAYDQAGNLVSTVRAGVSTTYGYDALNRLVSVRQGSTLIARYAYDVLGRRIAKRVYSSASGGAVAYTRFVYHGDQVAFETDSAGTLGLRYTWGLGTDDLVGVRNAGGNQYYVVQDKLGSVRGLYRQDGTWWMRQSFAPYGGLLTRDTTTVGASVPLRYGWTGREFDAETGWYYFRARYYDPQQRRFVQEDPIGHVGSTNLYAYVDGRALAATDPSGLKVCEDWARCGSAWPAVNSGETLANIRAGGAVPRGLMGVGDDLTDIFGEGAGYIPRQQARERIDERSTQANSTAASREPGVAPLSAPQPRWYVLQIVDEVELKGLPKGEPYDAFFGTTGHGYADISVDWVARFPRGLLDHFGFPGATDIYAGRILVYGPGMKPIGTAHVVGFVDSANGAGIFTGPLDPIPPTWLPPRL